MPCVIMAWVNFKTGMVGFFQNVGGGSHKPREDPWLRGWPSKRHVLLRAGRIWVDDLQRQHPVVHKESQTAANRDAHAEFH